MSFSSIFRRYVLPGLVFQSLIIAGGYGTGRELVEFFLTHGPVGGLLAMAVATVICSLVCAASFEFARTFHAYEYRHFFRELLGRGWVLFELGYMVLLLLVLAVIGAAAGDMLRVVFGLPSIVGTLGIMAAVGYLVFRGSVTIERFMELWSFVLYAAYVVLFVWAFVEFQDTIDNALSSAEAGTGWALDGARYAAYNLAVIPAVLFAVRYAERRRDAVVAGLLAGPIAIIPALLFFLAILSQYHDVLDSSLPVDVLLGALGSRAFQVTFQVILLGTLVETGTGLIHAVNERVAAVFVERGRTMPRALRPVIAVLFLVAGTLLSSVGLVALIAEGYGTLTWYVLAVFVVPILTWGVWRIYQAKAKRE